MANNVVNHDYSLMVKLKGDTDYSELLQITNADFKVTTNITSWTAYEDEGWETSLATGKSATITASGKYLQGDKTHDKLIDFMFGNASDQNGHSFKVVFPLAEGQTTPAQFEFNGVIDFNGSELMGESTDVSPINFDIKLSGKPKYTKGA